MFKIAIKKNTEANVMIISRNLNLTKRIIFGFMFLFLTKGMLLANIVSRTTFQPNIILFGDLGLFGSTGFVSFQMS